MVNAGREGVTTAIVKAGVLLLHRTVDLGADLRADQQADRQAEQRVASQLLDAAAAQLASNALPARQEPAGFERQNDVAAAIETTALAHEIEAEIEQEIAAESSLAKTADEVAQAVSVAAACFEDTLQTPPAAIHAAGTLGAAALTALLDAAHVGPLAVQRSSARRCSAPGLRMQTQDKTFIKVLQETISSPRPIRSLYAGTPAFLIRDLLYLPICIPLAEKLKKASQSNNGLTEFFKSTFAFTISGAAASALSYPFQYIGVVQKNSSTPLTMKQVFNKTRKESGFFGIYRGFGVASARIALYNCLFGSAISLGERILNRFC